MWVGLHEPPRTAFTVSAQRLGDGELAEFRRFGGDWHRRLVIGDGRRSADGYPPHWSFEGRFPSPGCWAVEVSWGSQVHRVVLPVGEGEVAAG